MKYLIKKVEFDKSNDETHSNLINFSFYIYVIS